MHKFLKPLFFAVFISLYSCNFIKAGDDKSYLLSNNEKNTFSLNESSTFNSYQLNVRSSSEIKPSIREIPNGYEIVFSAKKGSTKDPFIGISNTRLTSNSTLVENISVSRSPGQLKISIDTSSLHEPRLSLSKGKSHFRKKSDSFFNYYIEFIASPISKKDEHFSRSEKLSTPSVSPIAQSSSTIFNPYRVSLNGPNITLNLDEVDALQAIKMLCESANYNFVYVKDNPNSVLSSSSSSDESSEESQSAVIDEARLISLNFINMPYSDAFNAILASSGYQAKLDNNIVFVGTNLTAKPIGNKLSKTYRLNQVTAKAAAEFLGNLGASISFTNTVTTSVSQGMSSSESVQGGGTSSTTTSRQNPEVQIYSSKVGPLVGILGTTDERLAAVTLIGEPQLLELAHDYLKQIDLKQRQVALSVEIIDLDLTDDDSLSSTWSLLRGASFLLSRDGAASIAFGRPFPPLNDNQFYGIGGVPTAEEPYPDATITNRFDPSGAYGENELKMLLTAVIKSGSAKTIANPTIILMEDNNAVESETAESGSSDSISGADFVGSVGRPLPNEGRVVVGTNVVTNYTSEGDAGVCTAELGVSGLSLAARVSKIDDSGYVSFTLTPQVTGVTSRMTNPQCGTFNILSSRLLETGTVRVKDGDTLVLTGVVSEDDANTVTKWPLLSDIPMIGRFFRSENSSSRKHEMIITITPKIIQD